MRIDLNHTDGNHDLSSIDLVLSRRNLLALLSKLNHPESAKTLIKYNDGITFRVVAESDEDHYADRVEGPAGGMIDYTEEDIARLEKEGIN